MDWFSDSSAKISPINVLRYLKQIVTQQWRANKHWARPGGSSHVLWDHQFSNTPSGGKMDYKSNERKRKQSLNSGDLHKWSISKIFLAHSSLVLIIIKTFLNDAWDEESESMGWACSWEHVWRGAEFEKGRGSKMSCMSVFPNKKNWMNKN